MRKILVSTLALSSVSAFAVHNAAFQKFDDQYNLGYSVSQTTLSNGAQNQTLQQNQTLNLEVERLFNAGIWMDVTANLVLATNSLGNQALGTGQGMSATSQDPALGGVNAKVGYAFPLAHQHVQVIPYGTVGRNTNTSYSTIVNNTNIATGATSNITNDFFYSAGVGARLEYRINQYVMIYGDQNGVYNWDQSGPLNGVMPQNNMVFTSTLGAKFNVVKNLQLGLNGFYNNYQYEASVPTPTVSGSNGGFQNGQLTSIYQPQSTIGGMLTVGLTYR